MIKNYIKVALRNLWKQKSFSAINIVGLAVGLCCFLLIAMYVMDEVNYDRFHQKADRIHRINADILFGGGNLHFTQTSDMMGSTLKKDFPEVEDYCRIYNSGGNKMIKKGAEYVSEWELAHVDSTFFRVFTLPAIAGDTKNALNEPNTVVLTRSAALKYFNTTNAVGKMLETNEDNGRNYKVTAVVEDVPTASHFRFNLYFSMKDVRWYEWGQYLSHNFHTYLLLREGTDVAAFEKKAFAHYIANYVMPQAKQFMQINSIDEFRKAGNKLEYSLIPITKIHLYSDFSFEITPSGNIQYVYIFSAVALFILLIACVNFTNLTTARSANRAKEVGIRKVLGTERKDLVVQFLSESTLMALIALTIALLMVYLVLPLFNDMASKSMTMADLQRPYVLPLLLLLPFAVGLMAGSYPAFYLSSFRPILVLKGRIGNKRATLRSTLVVFQFATSIVLIIGTIVIFKQLRYIQSRDLGFKKEQVLVIDNAFALQNNLQAFRNQLLALPGVVSGTVSGYLPVSSSSRSDNTFSKEAVMDTRNGFNMQTWEVDDAYVPTMGMQIKMGRNFSKQFGTDSAAAIINETTAGILGYDNPLGKTIYRNDNGAMKKFTIIGVVKNFNYESLKQSIGPLALFYGENTGSISLRIQTADVAGLVKTIESKWKTLAPSLPYSYRFLDEAFDEMYRSEQRIGKIALAFSILAILIACLGLFGLAAFVAEQRTKEIGIRKVLGASVNGLVALLSKDFIRLVVISFVIAAPLAWWAMHKWLQDFAYRINIDWAVFVLAGLAAFLIAILTVSFQAVKAALTNPVKNLRTE